MKTIRSKLVTIFTSTLWLTVGLQILFTAFFAEDLYINGRKEEIAKVYSLLTTDYTGNSDDIYTKVCDYEDEYNLRVVIFDSAGTIVYQTLSGNLSTSVLSAYNLGVGSQFFIGFMHYPEVQLLNSYRNDSQSLVIRGSILVDDTTHYIIVESPLSTITDAAKTLAKITFFVNFAGMFFGAMIIYFFSRKLSKPLTEISKVATNLTNLDFSTKVKTTGHNDEIDILANNINQMSSTLETLIIELKTANAELQRDNDLRVKVDNMRKEFVSNVSHELKTPLALMQGYAEILQSDLPDIDKSYYHGVIVEESQHMNDLVNRLLNTSSLENGLTKLNFEFFDLCELTTHVITKTRSLAPSLNVNLQCNELQNLVADKLYIEQVITNLLTNAFTYANDKINIIISSESDNIRFEIENDGEQISQDFIENIWFSFSREDKSRTRNNNKNLGLGLYIAKTIISAHYGEIGVNNTTNGVCFWFEIDKNLEI